MNVVRRTLEVLIVGTCLLPTPARTQATGPSMHKMQWRQRSGKTTDDGSYSRDSNREGQIQVEVSSSQKVTVLDSGTSSARIFDKFEKISESTHESVKWSNTWTGTASINGESMQLDLKLASHQCQHEKTTNSQPPAALPCQAVSGELRMTCKIEQIPIQGKTGMRAGGPTVAAWMCNPEGNVSLAETQLTWVLGRGSCVKRIADRPWHSHYEKCGK